MIDREQTRTKLARFNAVSQRFAAQLKRCSPDVFIRMGRIYHDVAGVEKRLDHFIEALAREEFRETECARELDGCGIYSMVFFIERL